MPERVLLPDPCPACGAVDLDLHMMTWSGRTSDGRPTGGGKLWIECAACGGRFGRGAGGVLTTEEAATEYQREQARLRVGKTWWPVAGEQAAARMWDVVGHPTRMLEVTEGRSARKARLLAVAALATGVARGTSREDRTRLEAAERFADGTLPVGELRQHWPGAGAAVGPERAEEWARAVVAGESHGNPPRIPWARLSGLIRDIFGNPFRPVAFSPVWRSETIVALAVGIYEERAFDRLPILADALEEAGCDHADILAHCRGPGPHVRGCWVVDLVLGKS